jgi:hypothetical protein
MAPIGFLIGGLAAQAAHATETVSFNPGTYYLSDSDLGPVADTLVVTLSGGTADFTLSGTDNATFTVPNNSTPSGGGSSPYYLITGSSITASWDTTAYPYLTFWSTGADGGVTAGSVPGDSGTNDFNTFQSTDGTGQVFTATGVPEPGTWTLILIAFSGVGAGLRAARKAPMRA